MNPPIHINEGKQDRYSYNFINERENSGSKSASSYLSASLDLKWNILYWLTYQFTGGYSDNNSTNEKMGIGTDILHCRELSRI